MKLFSQNKKTIYLLSSIFLTLLLVFVFLLLHKFAYNLEKSKLLYATNTNLNSVINQTISDYTSKQLNNEDCEKQEDFLKTQFISAIQKEVIPIKQISAPTIVLTSDSTKRVLYSNSKENLSEKWKSESVISTFYMNNKEYTCYYHINNIKVLILSQLKSAMLFTVILILFFILIFTFIITRWRNGSKESKLKDDFFQNVTHELKTPIATTAIAMDIFKKFDYDLPKEKVRNYIEIMGEENRKMKQIVDRILSISVVENSIDSKISFSEIDIHKILQTTLKNVQFVVSETGGEIIRNLNAENAKINGDESLITMIFTNLIDNAIKYSQSAPVIKIESESNPKGITIRITDKGIGIPAEALHKIFIKTYRIKSNSNIKGFGLGLYFVKQLVDLHHGKITVKSELNVGSEFSVFLPYNH